MDELKLIHAGNGQFLVVPPNYRPSQLVSNSAASSSRKRPHSTDNSAAKSHQKINAASSKENFLTLKKRTPASKTRKTCEVEQETLDYFEDRLNANEFSDESDSEIKEYSQPKASSKLPLDKNKQTGVRSNDIETVDKLREILAFNPYQYRTKGIWWEVVKRLHRKGLVPAVNQQARQALRQLASRYMIDYRKQGSIRNDEEMNRIVGKLVELQDAKENGTVELLDYDPEAHQDFSEGDSQQSPSTSFISDDNEESRHSHDLSWAEIYCKRVRESVEEGTTHYDGGTKKAKGSTIERLREIVAVNPYQYRTKGVWRDIVRRLHEKGIVPEVNKQTVHALISSTSRYMCEYRRKGFASRNKVIDKLVAQLVELQDARLDGSVELLDYDIPDDSLSEPHFEPTSYNRSNSQRNRQQNVGNSSSPYVCDADYGGNADDDCESPQYHPLLVEDDAMYDQEANEDGFPRQELDDCERMEELDSKDEIVSVVKSEMMTMIKRPIGAVEFAHDDREKEEESCGVAIAPSGGMLRRNGLKKWKDQNVERESASCCSCETRLSNVETRLGRMEKMLEQILQKLSE